MTIYFSATTCSFYNTDVYPENNLPEDCVIVEESVYQNLMAQQNAGYVIVADSDGNPSVMSQSCGSCNCTVHEKTVASAEHLGHVKIDGEKVSLNENGELNLTGYVDKTSDETISGVKTFTDSPFVPTAEATSNDMTVANTAFVKNAISGFEALPNQTDNAGKVLTTDGTTASWTEIKSGGSGRNVGDIFYTSRLDAELNGAVEANGGTYNVADFTGEKSVPALLTEGKLPFVSFEEYESIVATNGSCRAFGYERGDTFRVPKLNDVYLMAGTAETAGEFINESLPNLKGYFAQWKAERSDGVLFKSTAIGAISNSNDGGADGSWRTDFDASAYSSAYKDGAKVRPDSVRYRAMVHLSNEATDEALMTCTGVLADVSYLKQRYDVIDISATSGTVTLTDNTIYSGTMTDAMTFVLPTITDATKYHQIKAMLYLPVVTIDWGTTRFIGGETPDVSEAGQYMIYWDYVPALSSWVVGAMKVV